MEKHEFKARWESDDQGGGINFDDIAECAVAWGVAAKPRTMPIDQVRYMVLKAAGTNDAEEFNPATFDEEVENKIYGQLELDKERGVLYFHSEKTGCTMLRICGLQFPDNFGEGELDSLDVTLKGIKEHPVSYVLTNLKK